jgi:uncharacterized membrane protein HdeD (DUF308 family)
MGVYAILNLNDTAEIVMIIIGVMVTISGILNIVEAFQLKKEY